jgi:hypothetical protein
MFRRAVLTTLALAVVLVLAVIEPSFAASDIGKNVGGEVTSWAKGLLLGTAALVGLPALFRRDVGQGVVILLIVVIVGGFVYAGGQVQDTVQSMWKTVAGTNAEAK